MKYLFLVKRDLNKLSGKNGSYDREIECIESCLSNKPATWSQYIDVNNGWRDIISMENTELQAAIDNGDYSSIIENLCHVSAACVYAHNIMTCDKE